MEDTFKHQGWRRQMVDALREKGIADESVLRAMTEVPRHLFLETMLDYMAYEDRAFDSRVADAILEAEQQARLSGESYSIDETLALLRGKQEPVA